MELRPDVSLVVVVNDKEQVLVIRRSELSSDTGRWESPVGHRDSGETAREAALREVKEETGLDVTLFPESFEKKNPDGKTIAVFMAKADTEEVKLEPKEHDSFKWLTLKEVADLSPTHPSYKSDVRKIIKMNAESQQKSAGVFYRNLPKPVGVSSLGIKVNQLSNPEDFPANPENAGDAELIDLDVMRTKEPRWLTKFFDNPQDNYDFLIQYLNKQSPVDIGSNPAARAAVASQALPKLSPMFKQRDESVDPNKSDLFDLYEESKDDIQFAGPGIRHENAVTSTTDEPEKKEKEAMSIGRGYLPPQLRQNNYLATYPLGARMPAKPNPAAQVKPKAIKADAQGVQAAMNKMGTEKKARNLNLGSIPVGTGPQQMANALGMHNQAKALINTEGTLKKHNLNPHDFEKLISSLAESDEESFDFDSHRSNPKTNSIVGGLLGAGLGGGVGYLGGGLGGALGGAAAGGLGGAGYGYMSAANKNQNLLNTAKVLREYGLLQPEYLRQAMPLLKTSETKPQRKVKIKENDLSSGSSAIDSLKEHMRKSGFDSFQTSFFTRLAEQGYTAEQVKQAVAKVESIDKEAADSLKSGFEKIANPWLNVAKQVGSGIKNQLPGIGKAIWNGGKGAVGKVRGNIASLQSSATKSPLATAKALAPRVISGATAGATNPSAPNLSTAYSDPLGYASSVAPHMAAGALATTIGGKPAARFARGANTGSAVGGSAGMLSDYLGYTKGMSTTLGNAGWGLGGLGSASRVVKPETAAKFDVTDLGLKGIRYGLNSNVAKAGLPAAGLLGGGFFASDAIMNAADSISPFNPANKDKVQQMMSDALSSNKDFQGAVSGLNNATSSVANAANSFGETAKSWQPGSLLGGQGGGGNGLGDMFGNLGQTFKDNPWLLPILLSGLGGAGAGYAMGGGGGAMLGGLGLPLIMYLLSQRNSQQAGTTPPAPPAASATPPATPQSSYDVLASDSN